MTVSQMCTCGARFHADTIPEVWQLLDAHCDLVHGRRFPRGAIIARYHPYTAKPRPALPRRGDASS